MRFLVQFEYLDSAGISVSEINVGGFVSRVFICGTTHWSEAFEPITIEVPCDLKHINESISQAIRELKSDYPVTRNHQVWIDFPADITV